MKNLTNFNQNEELLPAFQLDRAIRDIHIFIHIFIYIYIVIAIVIVIVIVIRSSERVDEAFRRQTIHIGSAMIYIYIYIKQTPVLKPIRNDISSSSSNNNNNNSIIIIIIIIVKAPSDRSLFCWLSIDTSILADIGTSDYSVSAETLPIKTHPILGRHIYIYIYI